MAKVEFKGIKDYIKMLEGLGGNAYELCKAATFAGAAVAADEIRKAIDNLDAVSDAEALAAYQERKPTKISVSQKNGLRKALGIAHITNKYGVIGTKVGFDGYNVVTTRRWWNGQPNRLIANACESGSTAMIKQPFVRPAVNRSKNLILFEMERAADKKLKEILGGNAND